MSLSDNGQGIFNSSCIGKALTAMSSPNSTSYNAIVKSSKVIVDLYLLPVSLLDVSDQDLP